MKLKSEMPQDTDDGLDRGGSSLGRDFQNTRAYRAKNLPTTQHLAVMAQTYLSDLERRMQQASPEILQLWPQVAGEFAKMTRAKKFENGILLVTVRNSTVLSMLHQKKAILISALQQKIPGIQLLDIMFRFG